MSSKNPASSEEEEVEERRYHHDFTESELEQLMYQTDENADPVVEYHYMKKIWQTDNALIGGNNEEKNKKTEEEKDSINRNNIDNDDDMQERAIDTGHRTVVDLSKNAEHEDPVFLDLDTSTTAHVVEFYAPWCPHCQQFKKEYIQIARETTRRSIGTHVEFHAVSCQLYREVCRAYNIDGFPVVLGYAIGESIEDVGWELNRVDTTMTAESIAEVLSLTLAHEPKDVHRRTDFSNSDDRRAYEREMVEMGHQAALKKKEWHEYPHQSLNDRYHNAATSLAFALRTGVFMKRENALDDKRRLALVDFVGVVDWASPAHWHVRKLVHDLPREMGAIAEDPELLGQLVEQHQSQQNPNGGLWGDIVTLPTKQRKEKILGLGGDVPHRAAAAEDPEEIFWGNNRWTEACTHSEPGMGFSCGLWDLFHILTMGASKPSRQLYGFQHGHLTAPKDVAEIIKRFIANFFACDVCRFNFLDMYDRCGHDHCHRLVSTSPIALGGDEQSSTSRELAMWLWEVHNAVNVRLMKESAERDNRKVTKHERLAAMFPTKHMCPECWLDSNMTAFDKEAVFDFLQSWYWPSEDTTRFARRFNSIIPSKARRHLTVTTSSKARHLTSYSILLIPLAALAVITRLFRRTLRRAQSQSPRKNV
jgi:thiol-disulfide isomerase/thioredoxin